MRGNEICSLYLDNVREISGNQRSKSGVLIFLQNLTDQTNG